MSFSYQNHSLIENLSLDTFPLCILILGLVEFFLLHIIKFFSRSQSLVQSPLGLYDNLKVQAAGKKNQRIELSNQLSSSFTEKIEDGNLCREDVDMVMERLGISCNPQGQGKKLEERWGSSDLSNLFEEEPSLDEVKGAFDVFDENRDGFIEATELQRVLCALGFKDGLEIENCSKLIAAFDENADGRIDFSEFVKLMENSFC
uniref:Putative calcium-binding protein CML45 isoform X1 n=1 Tax=Davidia involucrata TaxID=16924 RepID=A0A5B6YZ17_DAVIN